MGSLVCKKEGSKDAVWRTRDCWDLCVLKFSLKLSAVVLTGLNERAPLEERKGINGEWVAWRVIKPGKDLLQVKPATHDACL